MKGDLHPMFDVNDNAALTPADIAKMMKIDEETVRRWCRTGRLRNYKTGGFYTIPGSWFKEFIRSADSALRHSDLMVE